jgi:1-phosphatidylinositol-4-phosphate 5-kinase
MALNVVTQFVSDAVPDEDEVIAEDEFDATDSSDPSSPSSGEAISSSTASSASSRPEIPPFDVTGSTMELYGRFVNAGVYPKPYQHPEQSLTNRPNLSRTMPRNKVTPAAFSEPTTPKFANLTMKPEVKQDNSHAPKAPSSTKGKPQVHSFDDTSTQPHRASQAVSSERKDTPAIFLAQSPLPIEEELKLDSEDSTGSTGNPVSLKKSDDLTYVVGKDGSTSNSREALEMEELVRKAVDKCLGNAKVYALNPDALVVEHKKKTIRVQSLASSRFGLIRKTFGVQEQELVTSICKSGKLSGGVSKGKSGQFFFATSDHKFVLKTLTEEEFEFLEEKFVLEYASYMAKHKNSLLPRFYACIKIATYRFIIMNNVFCTDLKMVEVYDLKGSTVGRVAKKEEESILKDNDLLRNKRQFYFSSEVLLGLYLQLTEDVQFLSDHNVMDYSLLIGVHIVDEKSPLSDADYKFPEDVGFKSMFQKEFGGMFARDTDDEPLAEIYFLGVIDILQNFGVRKKLENMIRSITEDSNGISALPPDPYSNRFLGFVFKNVVKYEPNRKNKLHL